MSTNVCIRGGGWTFATYRFATYRWQLRWLLFICFATFASPKDHFIPLGGHQKKEVITPEKDIGSSSNFIGGSMGEISRHHHSHGHTGGIGGVGGHHKRGRRGDSTSGGIFSADASSSTSQKIGKPPKDWDPGSVHL
jgi:hypothetical protein